MNTPLDPKILDPKILDPKILDPKIVDSPTLFLQLQRHWPKLLALLLWLLLLTAYLWYTQTANVGPLEGLLRLIEQLRQHRYGPLLYTLLYAVRPLTFFSAGLLSVVGGYLFGPMLGLPVVIIASNLSALVAYLIGRYLTGGLLLGQQPGGLVQRYTHRLHSNSFETVLIMRLLLLPFDIINYLCGFLRIGLRPYLLGSVLGTLPGTIGFVLFGSAVENIDKLFLEGKLPGLDWRVLFASFLIFAISIGLSRYFKQQEAQSRF